MNHVRLTAASLAGLALSTVLLTAGAVLPAVRDPVAPPLVPLDRGLPPRSTVTALAGSPLAAAIFEGVALAIGGQEIDLVLLDEAVSDGCLGVKLTSGKLHLALGGASFEIGADEIALEIVLDRVELTGIDIKTKTPLSGCDWSGAFGVGVTASNVRFSVRLAPRVRLDDCLLVDLDNFSTHFSIGDLNVKNVQNDIDNLLEKAIEASVNASLSLVSLDLFENVLQNSLLQLLCETKLALYKAYMASMFGAVETFPLPPELVSQLAPLYPAADLGAVRIGYRWQPASNNTTDCSRIYFSDPDLVQRLRHGMELDGSEWNLVFHELRHTEQCARLGGRDAYAKRWFRDLEYALLLTHLSNPMDYILALHDNMPLEEDASSRAEEIVVVEGTVMEAVTNEPVAGIEVSAFPAGTTVTAATTPTASDRTSISLPPKQAGGRFTLFLEVGTHDLHVTQQAERGGVGFNRRHLAIEGLSLFAGDQLVSVSIEVDAKGNPLPGPQTNPVVQFRRGDVNASGDLNISDASFTLVYLFASGEAPRCLKAADTNDDGRIDISDPLATLGFLFLGSSAPPAPFPASGVDPTEDGLGCLAAE